MQLYDNYPQLMKYFIEGIKHPTRSIAHSILFYGEDIQAQYDLAFEIARLLNCSTDGDEDCTCLNCNWIRDRQHPAVLVYSRVDNKPSDDTSKTVISVKQSQEIKNNLTTTSEFHRVFIFCDRDKDDELQGLNQDCFQEETANSLLKTIEEPPSGTTFFFLTRNKNDLISTIVSRSQCFFVPQLEGELLDFEGIEDLIGNYWEVERQNAFDFAQKILMQTKLSSPLQVLNEMQNYMLAMIKSNINNHYLKLKFLEDIKKVETAKKQLKAFMQPQPIIENLCLELL